MKILVLGSGLMGPAAAFNAMSDPAVTQVTICDINQQQLDAARAKLASMEGSEKLSTVALDLNDQAATGQLMAGFDAIVAALSKNVISLGMRAALAAGTPLVDLSWPPEAMVADIKQQAKASGTLIVRPSIKSTIKLSSLKCTSLTRSPGLISEMLMPNLSTL